MHIFVLELQKLTGLHLPWWDATSDARDAQLPLHYRRQNRLEYTHTLQRWHFKMKMSCIQIYMTLTVYLEKITM